MAIYGGIGQYMPIYASICQRDNRVQRIQREKDIIMREQREDIMIQFNSIQFILCHIGYHKYMRIHKYYKYNYNRVHKILQI